MVGADRCIAPAAPSRVVIELERGRELNRVRAEVREAESGNPRKRRRVEETSAVPCFRIEAAEVRPRLQVSAHEPDLPVSAAANRADAERDIQLAKLDVARVFD